jgi:hypothetical protein
MCLHGAPWKMMVVVKERGADTIKMAYGTAWLEMATYLKLQVRIFDLGLV